MDAYRDFARPTQIALWEEMGGIPKAQMAYRLAIMDAKHEIREHLKNRRTILGQFSFIPYVRSLLHYWKVYEECYVATATYAAQRILGPPPEVLPANVIRFPGSYDGSL